MLYVYQVFLKSFFIYYQLMKLVNFFVFKMMGKGGQDDGEYRSIKCINVFVLDFLFFGLYWKKNYESIGFGEIVWVRENGFVDFFCEIFFEYCSYLIRSNVFKYLFVLVYFSDFSGRKRLGRGQ